MTSKNKEWDKNLQEVQKEKNIFFHSSQAALKIREKNDYTNDSLTHPNVKKKKKLKENI